LLKKVLLPLTFLILAWGFWVSPQFKEIAAGVAIFLFGMGAFAPGRATAESQQVSTVGIDCRQPIGETAICDLGDRIFR